jgi:hypothetical protein
MLPDRQTQDHAQQAINKCQAGLMSIMQKFNMKHNEMVDLKIWGGECLKNTYILPEIQKEGLFNMDIDSNLWEAVALAHNFPSGEVPDWLGNDNVCRDICFVQDYLNANRKAEQCLLEFNHLNDWYQDKYQNVVLARRLVAGKCCILC